jgi:hypothetical protein
MRLEDTMMTKHGVLAAARDFIYREARPLEQRLFATLFEGAQPEGTLDALRGYHNEDGGFGYGLEPDIRCPDSQPLDVEVALQTMDDAGWIDREMARGACDFLASVSDEAGGVPVVLPSIAGYPRAEHWGDGRFPPGVNPTAGIVGLLYKLGIEHPWRERAASFCWDALDTDLPTDAHTILEALTFLEHVPERDRAEHLIPRVAGRLAEAAMFNADPNAEGYGLTPLHFALSPTSRWRALFDDSAISGHLDRLQAGQTSDGGWTIVWQPPSQASTLEWRGRVTLDALRVLRAYGRLGS